MRVKITLACTECKQRNYNTKKNKKNDPDRLEMNKYCRFCRKHTTCTGKPSNTEGGKWLKTSKKTNIFQRFVARFFRDMRGEVKKIVWPTPKKQVINNTLVVLAVV